MSAGLAEPTSSALRERVPLAIGFAKPCTFLVHATGDITYPEVVRAMDELLAHQGMAPGCHVLVDAQAATDAPSTLELRRIAREIKPLISRGLGSMAIVTRPGFVHGVARMFAVFAELVHLDVAAFTDMQKAQDWLSRSKGQANSSGTAAS